jgi:hypothetical protein
MKTFYCLNNVGRAKYTVSKSNGTHKDGSPFFDIAIFRNKQKRNQYIKDLIKQGYTEK